MLLRYKMKQINSPEVRDDPRGIAHFLPLVYADIHINYCKDILM